MKDFILKAAKDVQDWNDLFDIKPANDLNFRLIITGSEIEELARAKTDDDRLDALVDVLWTVIGTGIDIGSPILDDDLAYAEKACANGPKPERKNLAVCLAYAHAATLAEAMQPAKGLEHLAQGLGIAATLATTALAEEFGPEAADLAWAEVRRTNFSKIWTWSEIPPVASKPGWEFTCVDADYHLPADEARYVARNEHGKIQKPPGWTGPDFTAAHAAAKAFREARSAR